MKRNIKYLLAMTFLISLAGCIKFRDPHEGNTPEEVQIKNLEEATIRGEMFLYTDRILTKEEYALALDENKNAEHPIKDDNEVTLRFLRLRIEPHAVLYTMGKKVNFNITLLEADTGARIATFPEGQTAPMATNGRSGGELNIFVERAEGHLQVEIRGEGGGIGLTGKDPDEKLIGKRGEDKPTFVVIGKGANACGQEKVGGIGGEGEPGYQGEPGKNGGDSGKLRIEILEDTNFKVTINRSEGKKGPGGEGGGGGGGGPGGYAKSCTSKYVVPNSQGPTGRPGKPGRPGREGDSGRLQPYCIVSPKQNFCVD